MKTFKDFQAFEKRVQKSIAWDDYFSVGGRMFKIYEYGDGMGDNYVYFVNKRTHDAILVRYHCPTGDWKKTGRVLKNAPRSRTESFSYDENGIEREYITTPYRFHSVEYIPAMELWRTDTL